MADDGEKWLSVAELARHVGKPERTVRRWVQQLAEDARQKRPNGRTVYNVAAFVALLSLIELRPQSANGKTLPTMAEVSPVPDAPSETPNAKPEQNDLVKELLADIQFLRAEVARHGAEIERRDVAEAELRRLMLADKHELTELRQKVALLIEPPPVQDDQSGQEAPQTARRAWWQMWRKGR
jgi:hypothetical protein